ncbi:MAG: hypothetical protein V4850_08630 [Myxococcota bacterium]
MAEPVWTPLDLSELIARLRTAKKNVEDAAAVVAAQQTEQVEALTSLVPDPKEQARVNPRRRYA